MKNYFAKIERMMQDKWNEFVEKKELKIAKMLPFSFDLEIRDF